MRGVLTTVLAVLAGLLVPVALTATWASQVVTDTDRYVETVTPLARDPQVVRAAERSLSGRAVALVESGGISAAVAEQVALEDVVGSAVRAVLASPVFPPVWQAANRTAHADLVSQLRASGPDSAGEPVTLDLGEVLVAVVDEATASLPVAPRVPRVEVPVTVLEGEDVTRARTAYVVLDASGRWLPPVVATLALVALVVGPRRGRVLGWLAVTSASGLGGLLVASSLLRDRVTADVPASDRALSATVWDALVADLERAAWVGIAAGAALLLLVLVVRLLRGPRHVDD